MSKSSLKILCIDQDPEFVESLVASMPGKVDVSTVDSLLRGINRVGVEHFDFVLIAAAFLKPYCPQDAKDTFNDCGIPFAFVSSDDIPIIPEPGCEVWNKQAILRAPECIATALTQVNSVSMG